MDKDQPYNTLSDTYRVFVPIEDHEENDLLKSVSVDENGDYIVQGIMTTDDTDEEDDTISPDGMDCSYFIEKGWVKYEHGKNPNQFIGEPLEVKVGRFTHPTLKKAVNGIFVKARLFANRELAKQAVEAINDLEKSHTKRRMGWSIEGNVVKRHPKTGKVLKSILRNVVLTMNPVNTTTWAELAKSFAKDHELTIDTEEPLDKSMDIEGVAPVTRQSLEGANPKKKKKDPQQEWIDAFRSTVKRALVEKSFRSEFIASPEDAELLAFSEALIKGLDYEEAEEVSSYVGTHHELLKSLVINFGGENMSAETKQKLSSLLDADLEELKKSLELDSEENQDEEDQEDEELTKSIEEDGDDSSEGGESDGEDGDEDEEGDDEEMEKSVEGSELRKSLAQDHSQAFEVSDFLSSIADEIGFAMEGMEKSIMGVSKTQNTLVKALTSFGDVIQKAVDKIENLETRNEELEKSLTAILQRPVGRKGVVNQREVQTLTKSLGDQGQPVKLTRKQVLDALEKSFDAGEIAGSVITRFEGGVPLSQLQQEGKLPETLQKSIGLI